MVLWMLIDAVKHLFCTEKYGKQDKRAVLEDDEVYS